MLFFIDETWQTIAGRPVGALGAVGIPRAQYNGFCREIWQIKKNVLGAKELSDGEIKGTHSFAKSAFHKRREAGFSRLLQAAEETLAAVPKYHGYAFAIWTTHEEWLLLRNPNPQALSPVYQELLKDFRRCITLSAVSPGLQAADLVAYLAAHRHDPNHRPELADYWTRVERIAFATKRGSGAARRRCHPRELQKRQKERAGGGKAS